MSFIIYDSLYACKNQPHFYALEKRAWIMRHLAEIHSTIRLRYRRTGSVIIAKITISISHCLEISVIPKKTSAKQHAKNPSCNHADQHYNMSGIHRSCNAVQNHKTNNCNQNGT